MERTMSKADSSHTTNPSPRRATGRDGRLSSMIVDPFVKAAFEAVERDRDDDHGMFVEIDHPPHLDGGAAVHLTGLTGRRVPVEG
jgi:hypothetical protein